MLSSLILNINILTELKRFLQENNVSDNIFLAVGLDVVPDFQHFSLQGLSRVHAQTIRKAILTNENPSKYGWLSQYHYRFNRQGNNSIFIFGLKQHYNDDFFSNLIYELSLCQFALEKV